MNRSFHLPMMSGVLVVLLVSSCGLRSADPPPAITTESLEPGKKVTTEVKPPVRPTTRSGYAGLAKHYPPPPWEQCGPRGERQVQANRVRGTVTAVSAEFIELDTVRNGGKFKYPPHVLLASGAVVYWEWDSNCYLLEDVNVGDEVTIGVGVLDEAKDAECFYIGIDKRPGGKMPPSRKPTEEEDVYMPGRVTKKKPPVAAPPVKADDRK